MVFETLDKLIEKALVTEIESSVYEVHDIIREFFYSRLNPTKKKEYHKKAAEYYQNQKEELAFLEAAFHLIRSQSQEEAAKLIIDRAQMVIEKGYHEEVMNVLMSFDHKLKTQFLSQIHKLKGQILDILRTRLQKYENATLARLLIAEGSYSEAIAVLDQVLSEAMKVDRIFLTIDVEILRAIAFHAEGMRAESQAAFNHALALAEPEGFMRVFLDHGEKIMPLLLTAHKESDQLSILTYIERLLNASEVQISDTRPVSSREREVFLEPLSDREIEVLNLLPSSLSSTEMADELSISVNTLRSHLKSIYSKLGAHSRYEAISRAREADLL